MYACTAPPRTKGATAHTHTRICRPICIYVHTCPLVYTLLLLFRRMYVYVFMYIYVYVYMCRRVNKQKYGRLYVENTGALSHSPATSNTTSCGYRRHARGRREVCKESTIHRSLQRIARETFIPSPQNLSQATIDLLYGVINPFQKPM